MASSSAQFSLNGLGLKLDTREHMAERLKGVDPTTIEQVHLGGNTIGVDAALELADFLNKAVNIKVLFSIPESRVKLLFIPHLYHLGG